MMLAAAADTNSTQVALGFFTKIFSSGTNGAPWSDPEKVQKAVLEHSPRVIAAILVFAIGLVIARWVGRMLTRGLAKREMEPPVRMLLIRFAKLFVMLITLMMAIQQLGFQLLPLIAGLGIAGVGVGLAMQGVLSNLVAGLTIIFVKSFRVGEYIEIAGVHGQVDTIELFSTTLVHADRSRIVVPNRKIVGEIIHNYGVIRQAELSVNVAYGTDLNRALEIIADVLRNNARVLQDPVPIVGTAQLGDSAIAIAIRPWVALADYGPVQAEVNKAVAEKLREHGIEIPFPQREIRVLPGSQIQTAA